MAKVSGSGQRGKRAARSCPREDARMKTSVNVALRNFSSFSPRGWWQVEPRVGSTPHAE